MLFPLTSSAPITFDGADEDRAAYRSAAAMQVIAPLNGFIVMLLLEEAPRIWSLYFEPTTPAQFPLFRGWLAPVPRSLAIVGFSNADSERMLTAAADEHRRRTGRPALDLGTFDAAGSLIGTRAIDLTDLEAGVHEIQTRWARRDFVAVPVVEGQVLYDGTGLTSAQLSLMWHAGSGPTADVIYWFDTHEYFQRVSDQRPVEAAGATAGFLPPRPVAEADTALERPFRIVATDASSSTTSVRTVELIGGMQNVSLSLPLRDSTSVPRQVLYLLRNEDEPMIEAQLGGGENARWELDWGGSPHELLAESANSATISWRHAHIAEDEVAAVERPLLITTAGQPARIGLFLQRNVVPLVLQVARRTLRAREAYYRWFNEGVRDHAEISNREALLLHNLIQDCIRMTGLPAGTEDQISEATNSAVYRAYQEGFRNRADRVEGNITSWPRSLRYYVFENPAFCEQLIAHPTEANVAILGEVFDALRGCEPGLQLLKDTAPGFFKRPGARLTPLNVDFLSGLAAVASFASNVREVLARSLVDFVKADLLLRINLVEVLIRDGADMGEIRSRLIAEYERYFAQIERVEVRLETDPATGNTVAHFAYEGGAESTASPSLGRRGYILEIFDGFFSFINVVIAGVNMAQHPTLANLLSASAITADAAVTLASLAFRSGSAARVLGVAAPITSAVTAGFEFYASVRAVGDFASRDDRDAAGMMRIAAVGAIFVIVGELATLSVVAAPLGVVMIAAGMIMMIFGNIGAAIEADTPVTSHFNHCLFGRQYRLTARADSAYHAWHGNLYRQIADLHSLFFPLEGRITNDLLGFRVTIAPKLFTGSARIFLEFFAEDDRSLSQHDLFFELDAHSRFAGSSELALSSWLLARVEGRVAMRDLRLIFALAAGGPFPIADVAKVSVVVSFGEVLPECSLDDFRERYAFSTRQDISRE